MGRNYWEHAVPQITRPYAQKGYRSHGQDLELYPDINWQLIQLVKQQWHMAVTWDTHYSLCCWTLDQVWMVFNGLQRNNFIWSQGSILASHCYMLCSSNSQMEHDWKPRRNLKLQIVNVFFYIVLTLHLPLKSWQQPKELTCQMNNKAKTSHFLIGCLPLSRYLYLYMLPSTPTKYHKHFDNQF